VKASLRRKIPNLNRISRFAATVAKPGGLALTDLGVSADAAQALPANQPVLLPAGWERFQTR
jgi:hypothetical protein